MTSKERMMTALKQGKPDRLPVTIHQWQQYHLTQYMGGKDQLEAFLATGLDASITPYVYHGIPSPDWVSRQTETWEDGGQHFRRFLIATPSGNLTCSLGSNEFTTFQVEHQVKTEADLEIVLRHWPGMRLDQEQLTRWYDRTGDAGIVRGFVGMYGQPGVWQDFCEAVGTQEAILWAVDRPEVVHHFLSEMTRRKLDYIHREMPGAKYDLIEHGGGAASSTVISPTFFDEFCVPYDRQVIDALHELGFPVVYHTCGGMMAILDRIPNNGCDASETLSPPGVGGDIKNRADEIKVKQILGSRVGLIGGIDQSGILTNGTPADVRAAVHACFETYGADGGYICSASDHFFHTPVENLKAMAQAGRECVYG